MAISQIFWWLSGKVVEQLSKLSMDLHGVFYCSYFFYLMQSVLSELNLKEYLPPLNKLTGRLKDIQKGFLDDEH